MSAANATLSMATGGLVAHRLEQPALGGCQLPRFAQRQNANDANRGTTGLYGHEQPTPAGSVSVPRPVGSSESHDQRAAARSAWLNSLSGGKAARRSSLPDSSGLFSGIRIATSAFNRRAR